MGSLKTFYPTMAKMPHMYYACALKRMSYKCITCMTRMFLPRMKNMRGAHAFKFESHVSKYAFATHVFETHATHAIYTRETHRYENTFYMYY